MLKVGEIAPEIDAATSRGDRFVLSRQEALCTVVYFYPKAFTPGCTRETKGFADNHNELMLAGATVVGVSTDDDETQCDFAAKMATPFPLIADQDRAISRAFGVLWPLLGVAKRVTFVIGPGRRVLATFRHELQVGKHVDDVVRFVYRYSEAARARTQASSEALWRARTEPSSNDDR